MSTIGTRTRLRAGAVAAFALVFFSHADPTGAHEPQDTSTTTEVTDAGPEPIAISAIAVEASALENRLSNLAAALATPAEQSEIADELDETVKHVQRQIGRLDGQLAGGYTRNDLDTMQAVWGTTGKDLDAWQKTLRSRLDGLDDLNQELEKREGVWKETANVAGDQSAPAEVREQIGSVSASIKKFQGKLRSSRDEALGLQKRVVELRASVATQLDRIEAAQEEVLTRLTARDAPPIWALELEQHDERREQAAASLEASRDGLKRYADRNARLLALHFLLIFGLTWTCVRARRLSLDDASSSGPEGIPPALRHPWAAGLLLGLSSGIWIHETGPPETLQIIGIAILPFWLIVVRDLLPKSLHRPVTGLAVLLLVDMIRRTFQDFSDISRLLLMTEIGALAAGLVWLRRPQRIGEALALSDRFWVQILGAWLRLAMVAALFSLVAVVGGWVNLGELVGSAIIRGSYAGSILLTAARLVEDIAESFAKTGRLDRFRLIRHDRRAFVRVVRHGARTVAFVTWILLLLGTVSFRAPALNAIGGLLATPMGYGNVNVTLGGICAFVATLYISWLLSRLVALTLDQEVFTRVSLPRGMPFALTTITRYMILVLGFILAVATLGFEVGNLALVISALGVGIGFGMQNVVNNFISGLILLFERPIKVGDLLQVDELWGNVTRIGIRSSTIRTFAGADVIVPNGDLTSNRVTNWTLSDLRRRVSLPVGVAYGTDAATVIELLKDVAAAHEATLEHPEPYVLFTGFGDSSLDFEIRLWTESEDANTIVRSDIAVATQAALARAGINVPFPQRDVHVANVVPVPEKS